jgi:NYN domain
MRTNFYIDAFNLYYGSLKDTAYKWLDLNEFCRRAFPPPRNVLNRVRLFAANVNARPHDPQQPIRQQTYFRALRTLPRLSIHLGQYLESRVRARLVTPLADGTRHVLIHKTEEKGSDVNLATYLLIDGFDNDYDVAVVVSNDSDLAEPISVVRRKLHKPVLAVLPRCNRGRRESVELKKVATKTVRVDPTILAASQLPLTINDATGTIHKPASW